MRDGAPPRPPAPAPGRGPTAADRLGATAIRRSAPLRIDTLCELHHAPKTAVTPRRWRANGGYDRCTNLLARGDSAEGRPSPGVPDAGPDVVAGWPAPRPRSSPPGRWPAAAATTAGRRPSPGTST